MKIKNNTVSNVSVPSLLTRGAAAKKYLIVVGEGALELDDEVWLSEYADNSAAMLEAGTLEIVTAPKLTQEQEDKVAEDALAAARELIAAADAKAKTTTDAPTATTKAKPTS